MPKPLFNTTAYKKLVKNVGKEFSDLEALFKRMTAEGYWRIGKYIEEHLLEHKDRAGYGEKLIEALANDVGRDISLLNRILKFYRAYPILATRPELSWSHYKSLITITDKAERKKLEQKIINKGLKVGEVQEYVAAKHKLATPVDPDKPIPQLKFTRGRLDVYQIVPANKTMIDRGPLAIDLGFREQEEIPASAGRLREGDVVEKGRGRTFTKCAAAVKPDELFTYAARVDKVIDGDTLLVAFDFGLAHSISQKLRLRGIDCPEIETEEGKKAKRFVESRLKGCDFIIVKTYKDRSDKFDRYLADVFCLEGCSDLRKTAAEGTYLNQELLDNRLAVVWK